MAEIRRRSVGKGWTWFEDYIFALANWTAFCPANRKVEVGMGVSIFGTPRGEKIPFSGKREFTTIGLGAIHFRVVDGRGPCEVILHSGKTKPIEFPDIRFEAAGAMTSEAAAEPSKSKFSFPDVESAAGIEEINELLQRALPARSKDESAVAEQLKQLEQRMNGVQDALLEIRGARYALRKQLSQQAAGLSAREDLGADCDGNRCRSERKNEPLTAGETDVFVHDDQDRGSVNVFCQTGEIEVVISTAVWSEFSEYDRKRLGPGQTWKRDIGSQHGLLDQTNRIEINGKADAIYNLDFNSWDN